MSIWFHFAFAVLPAAAMCLWLPWRAVASATLSWFPVHTALVFAKPKRWPVPPVSPAVLMCIFASYWMLAAEGWTTWWLLLSSPCFGLAMHLSMGSVLQDVIAPSISTLISSPTLASEGAGSAAAPTRDADLNQDVSVAEDSSPQEPPPQDSSPQEPSLRFPAGTGVLIHGLKGRPDLNGRQGIVEGFRDGRYNVEVPGSPSITVRVKAENLSSFSRRAELSIVDPRQLRKWVPPARQARAQRLGQQWGALAECFVDVVPSSAKFASFMESGEEHEHLRSTFPADADPQLRRMMDSILSASLDTNLKHTSPFSQWAYTLVHLVHYYETPEPGEPASRGCFRFLLAEGPSASDITAGRGSAPCVVIDILEQPRACPGNLAGLADIFAEEQSSAPLLRVRYRHVESDDASRSLRNRIVSSALPDSCPVADAALKAKGLCPPARFESCRTVMLESLAQLDAAVACLRENEERLSPAFREHFYAQSSFHSEAGGFRCSYLVPPAAPKPTRSKNVETCAHCGATAADGSRHVQCARCSTCYCNAACQRADWKVHKRVCKKSAEELREKPDGDRTSLVFSLVPLRERVGKYEFSVSAQTGDVTAGGRRLAAGSKASEKAMKPISSEVPTNVHGRRVFVVKVQPPCSRRYESGMLAGAGPFGFASHAELLEHNEHAVWAAMVYDEARSFTSYLKLDTMGIEPLLRHVSTHGQKGGTKGFFRAVREGTSLRIFTDRILDDQGW